MRREDREITNEQEILSILDGERVLRLGLMDGEYPYIVPVHYGYEATAEGIVFYIHGAKVGHKLDLIRENPNAFVELDRELEQISGGEDPCEYGAKFASFMGRGQASILEDSGEKQRALTVLMRHQTGRDFAFTQEMAGAVAVIRICVTDYTAKAKR